MESAPSAQAKQKPSPPHALGRREEPVPVPGGARASHRVYVNVGPPPAAAQPMSRPGRQLNYGCCALGSRSWAPENNKDGVTTFCAMCSSLPS